MSQGPMAFKSKAAVAEQMRQQALRGSQVVGGRKLEIGMKNTSNCHQKHGFYGDFKSARVASEAIWSRRT